MTSHNMWVQPAIDIHHGYHAWTTCSCGDKRVHFGVTKAEAQQHAQDWCLRHPLDVQRQVEIRHGEDESRRVFKHEHGQWHAVRYCVCGTCFEVHSANADWIIEYLYVLMERHLGREPAQIKHIIPAMIGQTDLRALCHTTYSVMCSCGEGFESPRGSYNQNAAMMSVTAWKNQHREAVKQEDRTMDSIETLRARRERIDAEIARVESLPPEPTTEDPDGALVIWFEKRIGGNTYTYAAVKTPNGWYTTGPRTPKCYTWQQLVEWINADDEVAIWQADSWLPV